MKSSNVGGQAVLEGVMMKHKDRYAVAVRKPDGTVVVEQDDYKSIVGSHQKLLKTPFIRGIFNFIDSMILGMKTLTWSAGFEEEEEVLTEKEARKREKLDQVINGVVMAVSFLIAIAIFMVLPYFLSDLFKTVIPSYVIRTILEGVIRILIFVGYIWLISRMEDIRRLYQYHGAEHKCINCIEHGLPLTVDNVRISSKEHKRCGTSFLMFVMIVGIVLLFFVQTESHILRVVIRIALLPVIAGISYEIIRLAGNSDNVVVNLLSRPGLMLQGLTTKEPDDSMIEVAIASVEAVFDWKAYLAENFPVREESGRKEEAV
ncbi:DUF1385 domain-containing protein [Sellimonas catena]|uniref:Membrane protein n=1 Tax=Sellimonas catena TaxID=2994035 RepID=A0A9W6FGM8_9FIRM|nr:DUF1385 domain-containing protein [Sellimonas catena]GLG04767.1 membrane protein [Sellimonas catena]GLG88973.1 membrane protein [Sellimonas catena]